MISCTKSGSNIKIGISPKKPIIDTEMKLLESDPYKEFLDSRFYTLNVKGERKYNIKIYELRFWNDTYNFYLLPGGGDPPFVEGSYQILDNKILLKYMVVTGESDYYVFDDIFKEDWELEYTVINDSLYYSEGLTGKGIIFGRDKSKPKNGEIRIVNEQEIIIQRNDNEEENRIKLTSDVIVRTGPGSNFQRCTFEWYDQEYWYAVTSITGFLRTDTPVYILGHSRNTDTDNGLTGYWYYCWIPVYPDWGGKISEPSETINNNAWIFGPSIGLR
jgi:hypothetical protein